MNFISQVEKNPLICLAVFVIIVYCCMIFFRKEGMTKGIVDEDLQLAGTDKPDSYFEEKIAAGSYPTSPEAIEEFEAYYARKKAGVVSVSTSEPEGKQADEAATHMMPDGTKMPGASHNSAEPMDAEEATMDAEEEELDDGVAKPGSYYEDGMAMLKPDSYYEEKMAAGSVPTSPEAIAEFSAYKAKKEFNVKGTNLTNGAKTETETPAQIGRRVERAKKRGEARVAKRSQVLKAKREARRGAKMAARAQPIIKLPSGVFDPR